VFEWLVLFDNVDKVDRAANWQGDIAIWHVSIDFETCVENCFIISRLHSKKNFKQPSTTKESIREFKQ
jgi:hypothetical protein